jgi:antitoxin CptB
MSKADDEVAFERLRWQCRRGLLELDYLLEAYLERLYPVVDENERDGFERLLRHPDPDLQQWLIDGRASHDPSLKPVIEHIRQIRL